jgi:16S rRNA A1518/A1519 N6-dimethyltransferase RsmA/KsgA/DIM1 with predicted DNA glycosylase/AP lyase activity
MLKNNLRNFINSVILKGGFSAEDIAGQSLAQSGLTGEERAENLGLEAFITLARVIEDMRT